jgi:hypothetical protein
MLKDFDVHTPYFYGVALATIIAGAALFALGAVEWLFGALDIQYFMHPLFKAMGGLVIMSLGYIHLELELMRIHRNRK